MTPASVPPAAAHGGLQVRTDPVSVGIEWPYAIVRCDGPIRGCGMRRVLGGYPNRRRLEAAANAFADAHRATAGAISGAEAVFRIVAASPGRFPEIVRRAKRAAASCEAGGGECPHLGLPAARRWPIAVVPRGMLQGGAP